MFCSFAKPLLCAGCFRMRERRRNTEFRAMMCPGDGVSAVASLTPEAVLGNTNAACKTGTPAIVRVVLVSKRLKRKTDSLGLRISEMSGNMVMVVVKRMPCVRLQDISYCPREENPN